MHASAHFLFQEDNLLTLGNTQNNDLDWNLYSSLEIRNSRLGCVIIRSLRDTRA